MSKLNSETDFALEMQGYFSDASRTDPELFSWLYYIARVINNNHEEIELNEYMIILDILNTFTSK